MTKAELINALFGYDDQTEIVVLTQGRDTQIRNIKSIKTAEISGASAEYEEKNIIRLETE